MEEKYLVGMVEQWKNSPKNHLKSELLFGLEIASC
jgi:hypothetical protein